MVRLMPAPIDVDKEQVRMLVLAVGCTEAARQLGLPETAVRQWSSRGKWLEHAKPQEKLPLPPSMRSVTTVTKSPADALESILAERKNNTRLGLSRYVERMSQTAAEGGDLEHAQDLKAVASIASTVWPEQTGSQTVNLINIRFE